MARRVKSDVRFIRALEHGVEALASGLFLEQEAIMSASKQEVPVDLGVLRASGTVLPPDSNGTIIEVVSGYGGAAEAYAIVQHERLSYRHTVGKAKYLEHPFLARAPQIPANLAKRVEAAWQRLRIK